MFPVMVGIFFKRLASILLAVGGWLITGVRTALDIIGWSTAPDDVGTAMSRLDKFLIWLLALPWWVPWGFALISTLWLMWVSWPRGALLSSGDGRDSEIPPSGLSSYSNDAPGTAPDRQSYWDLLSFTSQYLLPSCDALIDLQKELIAASVENSTIRDFAIAGMLVGSKAEEREFWRNYNTLEQHINQSEPTIEFSAMIRCIRALELRGYGQFRTETASLARQIRDKAQLSKSVLKAGDDWIVRHNSLIEKYEKIRNDPRFSGQNTDGGSLFWPRKRNGFGSVVVRRDPLNQLEALDSNSRKALE